jgi:ankyrin repeat protein
MQHIFNIFLPLTPKEEIICLFHEHAEGAWTYFYAIDYLMSNGYDYLINEQDVLGKTPFHYACRHRDDEIYLHCEHYMTKFMKIPNLLVNVKDNIGRTPLHEACRLTNIYMVRFLLSGDYNINVNLSDNDGNSALHITINGWYNTMDDLPFSNILRTLLWKNPFLIFHKNDLDENTYDYAMRLQEENDVLSEEIYADYWSDITSLLHNFMHEARIKMFKYFMDGESSGEIALFPTLEFDCLNDE